MNEIEDLERRLQLASDRLERAVQAREWEEVEASRQEVLALERRLAAAKGDEYAEPMQFPLQWDVGAPMPHLMVNDYRAFLAFHLKSSGDEHLALVQFEQCASAKLGTPNDEVHNGHPLEGKGLEAYTAQRVVNSRWLKELESINSVHDGYRPESWQARHHYVFWFHDSTFECVAGSYTVETHRMSMKELLGLMVERLTA
jgi:hypothetical protein